MGWLTALTGYFAPAFLVMSPVFSYSDQALVHAQKQVQRGLLSRHSSDHASSVDV